MAHITLTGLSPELFQQYHRPEEEMTAADLQIRDEIDHRIRAVCEIVFNLTD
jgi:hypothetical protein